MAIIDGVPGLEVQILVDGEPLIEYDDEDEPGVHDGSGRKTISKFVEARSGAEFVIKCSFDAVNPYKTNDLQIAVYIDGKYMDDRVLYARQIQAPYISRLSGHRYRTGSQFFQRKFSFSELSIGRPTCRRNFSSQLILMLAQSRTTIRSRQMTWC